MMDRVECVWLCMQVQQPANTLLLGCPIRARQVPQRWCWGAQLGLGKG